MLVTTLSPLYLGRWPLILGGYLWCRLPCRELIMLSVSVQMDSGACGGSLGSDGCVTLSVHWEPPSDWLDPSAETSCHTNKTIRKKRAKTHPTHYTSIKTRQMCTIVDNFLFDNSGNEWIVKFLMIQAVKTRLMCLWCGLMAPIKPSKNRTKPAKTGHGGLPALTNWNITRNRRPSTWKRTCNWDDLTHF